ncbi:hypothetical protein PVAND_007738 [Polypedilum vanderplanki]|uniref:Sulfotransferase domain-containing protein n=1 Tax=Polypedilum vanderplanki TaxID=319348 RepID=A0A9J6C7V7_POLVA|nr:hypothetical protein PVAND_007738 [Polypedilum vanderplanki]
MEFCDLEDKYGQKFIEGKNFKSIEIKNGNTKCVMVKKYWSEYLEDMKNFEVFEDDVWVISYPKCGTTWTQEMTWLLNKDLDYDEAMQNKLNFRFPYIEFGGISDEISINTIDKCNKLSRPRHIKSHLPVFLLPEQLWTVKPKIIYITRNPKDAVVSYFHHYRNIIGYLGSRDEFFDFFLNDKLVYSPFSSHVIEFWKISKENSNVLFLFYENLKKNLDNEVKKVMKFLNKNYTQDQVDKLCEHLSFDSMKKNVSINWKPNTLPREVENQTEEKFEFIRKGIVGSHKKEMTENQISRFNDYLNRFSDYSELLENF